MMNAFSQQKARGFTLFYAVLVTSLLLALGLAVFNISLKELLLSSDARESQNALYAADTALECALYWDLKYEGISSPAFGFYGDSLSSGLAALWRMEEETGAEDRVFDYSGQGNHGDLGSGMDSGTAWVGGHAGGDALLFDGVDDEVEVPDDASLDFTNPGLTVSAWVRPTSESLSMGSIVWKDEQWALSLSSGADTLRAQVETDGKSAWGGSAVDVTYPFVAGVWAHIAFTYDGSDVIVYVNGTPRGTPVGASGDIVDNGAPVTIGAGNSWLFAGTIDDVRVYNRALSEEEVEAMSDDEPYNVFVDPVVQESGVTCVGADITDPATGWDSEAGWDVETGTDSATTTFDMLLTDGTCTSVTVAKTTSTTTIVARGYNTCDLDDQRRVERALRALY